MSKVSLKARNLLIDCLCIFVPAGNEFITEYGVHIVNHTKNVTLVIFAVFLTWEWTEGGSRKLCDKVAIIKNGKLVAASTMDEVKGDASLEETFLELEQK